MDMDMTETVRPARCGWQQEETDMLWREIRAAADSGAPLRQVFDRMGQALGRKPNSVRNYYYMQLRDQAGEELRRAAPFETFTEDEVHDLLRRVLMARGEGRSVRSCVMDMSNGDRTLMLRYQNKYRSILRKKPDLIAQVRHELEAEGLPCPDQAAAAPPTGVLPDGDPDAQAIWTHTAALAQRARENAVSAHDRLRVQRDLLAMQLEDLQSAAKCMLADCKDFLGEEEAVRPFRLDAFCQALSGHIARIESISG